MRLIKFLSLFFLIPALSYSQAELKGFITDLETGEPLINATIAVYQNDVLITGMYTNFKGYYSIKDLPTGNLHIIISFIGYVDQHLTAKHLHNGEVVTLDAKLKAGRLNCYFSCDYFDPLIKLDETTQGFKFSSEQINNMAFRW